MSLRRNSAGSRGRFAPYVLGVGLFGVALLNVVFGLYALLLDEPLLGHALAALLGGGFGGALLVFGHRDAQPTRREGLIAVTLLWVVVTVVGALPYRFGGGMSLVNALFESASGFTATGATALDHFDTFPSSLFIYRAVSQWLGGIGIIVLFIIVLPQFALAGRQLFFAEMTGPTEERLTPKLRQTAGAVMAVYGSLTALCLVAYRLAGMSFYDALAHTFTTVSAAGFSPRAESFVDYAPRVEWVAMTFMLLAGVFFCALYPRLEGAHRDFLAQQRVPRLPRYHRSGDACGHGGAAPHLRASGKLAPQLFPGRQHPHNHGLRLG